MALSRNFLIIGALYLVIGILLGSYMGASGDHALAPVHAHINLLGFTLMSVFGLIYRVFPEMAASALARAHFWLHQLGAVVLLVGLFLMMGQIASPDAVGPILPVAELAILLGTLAFLLNLLRAAR